MQRLSNPAKSLPLGRTPRQWSIYPAQNDQMLLLWIDRIAPDESRLFTALIAPDLSLLRGPTEVSNANTSDYAAAVLPDGDLQTLWVSRTPGVVPTLYAQSVDMQGRPQSPVLFARNAVHPTMAVNDGSRQIAAAWLEPQVGNVWSIRSGKLPINTTSVSIGEPAGHDVEVGLISLEAGHILENFVAGIDQDTILYLWSEVDKESRGYVQVLPIGVNSVPLPQFRLEGDLRAFSSSVAIGGWQAVGLNAMQDGQAVPAVAYFAKGKLDRLITFPATVGTLGMITLASDGDQKLYAAWTIFTGSGHTDIYLAQTP